MKAWQLTAANEPLRRIEREDPQPGPGQVVVVVRAAGICHSDVGFLDGTLTPMLPRLPMVLGHEVAGVVSEIGAEVSGVVVGDRVVILGPQQHAPGWSADGGFADKVLAMAEGLFTLPETVDFVQGATATDAGQTAYGAVMGTGRVRDGERVGIVGLGGLGLTGARIAVVAGARVYAAEPNLEVWPLAAERGVAELVEDVRELAAFDLDVIIDFAGFGTTTAGAISAVRPGGRVVVVGLGRNEATISTAELVYKSVTLRGSRGGQPGALESVLALMANGDLTIHATRIGFDEIPDAIERLKSGHVVGRIAAVMPDD